MKISVEHLNGLLAWLYDLRYENKISEAQILEKASDDPIVMVSLTLRINSLDKEVEIIYLYDHQSKSEQLHFMPHGGDDWCFHSNKKKNNHFKRITLVLK